MSTEAFPKTPESFGLPISSSTRPRIKSEINFSCQKKKKKKNILTERMIDNSGYSSPCCFFPKNLGRGSTKIKIPLNFYLQ